MLSVNKMNKKNTNNRKILSIVAITLLAVSMLVVGYDSTRVTEPLPVPPSTPISDYGEVAISFIDAKAKTGFESMSLPTYIPNGFRHESTRVYGQADDSQKIITAIFRPVGVETKTIDTFEEIISDGFVILYSTQNYDPNYGWDKIIQTLVDEAPQVRSISNIDGHQALIVKGNPSEKITGQALLYKDGVLINLVSMNLDSQELEKTLRSMIAN